MLSRDQIVEMVRVFLTADAATRRGLVDVIDTLYLTRSSSWGSCAGCPHTDEQFEVRRILKAFVDAQWLADFDGRLAEYSAEQEEDAVT